MSSTSRFADLVAQHEKRLQALEDGSRGTASLAHSSLHDGAINAYDALGQVRAVLGKQPDNTFALRYQSGPKPGVPSTPTVAPHQLALIVYWDGRFADGQAPGDLQRVDVHMSDTSGFTPDGSTVVGSFLGEGAISAVADNRPHYVKLVAVTTSDVPSDPTGEASATPLPATEIAAESIGAAQLAAELILTSKLIAGDPDGWRLELGDATTPVLYWNGTTTGFTLARDPATNESNVYVNGRVKFGEGSQLDADYVDVYRQPNTGYQTPTIRQSRAFINDWAVSSMTVMWHQSTAPGSMLVGAVCAIAHDGTVAPTITAPAGYSEVTHVDLTWSGSPMRLALYSLTASTSHTSETFTTDILCSALYGNVMEARNVAGLDVFTSTTGTQSRTNPLLSTGQSASLSAETELAIGVVASPDLRKSNRSVVFNQYSPGYGEVDTLYGGFGECLTVAASTVTVPDPTQMVVNTNTITDGSRWSGIIAAFRAAPASTTPPKPDAGTARFYTTTVNGVAAPRVIDDTGNTYPIGPGIRSRYRAASGQLPIVVDAVVQQWSLQEGNGTGVTLSADSTPLSNALFTLAEGVWQVYIAWELSGPGYSSTSDYCDYWLSTDANATHFGNVMRPGWTANTTAAGNILSDGTTTVKMHFYSTFAWSLNKLDLIFYYQKG